MRALERILVLRELSAAVVFTTQPLTFKTVVYIFSHMAI